VNDIGKKGYDNMLLIIIGVVLLGMVSILYLLLGLGAPLGFIAWGGKYEGKLPKNIRIQSIVSIPAQLFAAFVLLYIGGIVGSNDSVLLRIFGYVFMVYFFLNILMNLASKSKYETYIMTPVAVLVFICFVYALFF